MLLPILANTRTISSAAPLHKSRDSCDHSYYLITSAKTDSATNPKTAVLTTIITSLVSLLLLFIIGFAFWRLQQLSEIARWHEQENMPRELRWASLFASEQAINCETPVPLNGIPDQIYQTLFGQLVVVDNKTRNREVVYDSDILQLSTYRLILKNTTQTEFAGHRIRSHGYVRLSTPEKIHYERIVLLEDDEVIGYYRRYRELLAEQEQPEFTDNPGLCRQCGHRRVCLAALDGEPKEEAV